MASTNDLAYFPTAINSDVTVPIRTTLGCSKRDIAAINNNGAEYHLVFPQANNAQPIVIRFDTSTKRNNMYTSYMKDYGNSVAGS